MRRGGISASRPSSRIWPARRFPGPFPPRAGRNYTRSTSTPSDPRRRRLGRPKGGTAKPDLDVATSGRALGADRIAPADHAGDDHACVEAPKMELTAERRVDEAQGFEPEALGELAAAGVWLVGHLDHRVAKVESGTERNVRLAQIEVEVQLVTGEGRSFRAAS